MSDQLPLDFLPESPIYILMDADVYQVDDLPPNEDLLCVEPTKSFVESIRTFGVLTPIWIQADPEAEGWRVVAGRRRLKAARLAGLSRIPAIRIPAEYDPSALSLIENRQRDANPISDLEAVKTLMERGHSDKDIGKALGINLSSVKRLLTLSTLPEPVYEAVKRGDVAIGVAEKFARLTERQQDTILKSEAPEDITEKVVHDARCVELRDATASLLPDLPPIEEDVQVSIPGSLAERVRVRAMDEGLYGRDWIIRLIERELDRPEPAPVGKPRLRKPKQPRVVMA